MLGQKIIKLDHLKLWVNLMPSVIVYNQQNIQEWKEQSQQLIESLKELQPRVDQLRYILKPLREEKERLDTKINEITIEINKLKLANQINLNAQLQHHHHHDNHHGHGFDGHHHRHGGFGHHQRTVIIINTSPFEESLKNYKTQRSKLSEQMDPLENELAVKQQRINDDEGTLSLLKKHIPLGEAFLLNLQENPSKLAEELKTDILERIYEFARKNPTNLSPAVRSCILFIDSKLIALRPQPTPTVVTYQEMYPSPIPILPSERLRLDRLYYLRLCGLLWEMYYNVQDKSQNNEFTTILSSLINSTHIDQNGDLPDLLATKKSITAHMEEAREEESKRQLSFCYLAKQSVQEFIELEKSLFYHIYNETLKPLLQSNNHLQLHMENTVSLIFNEIKAKESGPLNETQEPIDYHFYTEIICDFIDILKKTPKSDTGNHLSLLTEYASGAPSIGKQIGGALLAVIGLLLIAASVAALLLTFGSTSLFTAFGIALGLSLLQFEITAGVVFSLTAAASAGLTFFGAKTITNGLQQGLSKEIQTVHDDFVHPERNLSGPDFSKGPTANM